MTQIVGPLIRRDFTEITSLNIGTPATGINAANVDEVKGVYHRTIIPIVAFPITLVDVTNIGGGALLYTFPLGRILMLGSFLKNLYETTTSALASTLNASVNLSVGVGTVQTTTQGSGTLATTQQDIVTQSTLISSPTINVPSAVAGKGGGPVPAVFDGSVTAIRAFLNCGVITATDIDGDATTTWDGILEMHWLLLGAL